MYYHSFFVIRHRFFFQFIVSLKIKDTKQEEDQWDVYLNSITT